MKASKVLIVLVNIGLIISTILLIVFVTLSAYTIHSNFIRQNNRDMNGVVTYAQINKIDHLGNSAIEYFYIYENGRVSIDQFFIKVREEVLKNEKPIYPQDLNNGNFSFVQDIEHVYLPVSVSQAKQYAIIGIVYKVLIILSIIIILYYLLKFLTQINKDIIFDSKNLTYLKTITWTAFVAMVLQLIISSVLNLLFVGKIAEIIGISVPSVFLFNYEYLLISLFLLVIVHAFKRGIDLQVDKDLTI